MDNPNWSELLAYSTTICLSGEIWRDGRRTPTYEAVHARNPAALERTIDALIRLSTESVEVYDYLTRIALSVLRNNSDWPTKNLQEWSIKKFLGLDDRPHKSRGRLFFRDLKFQLLVADRMGEGISPTRNEGTDNQEQSCADIGEQMGLCLKNAHRIWGARPF